MKASTWWGTAAAGDGSKRGMRSNVTILSHHSFVCQVHVRGVSPTLSVVPSFTYCNDARLHQELRKHSVHAHLSSCIAGPRSLQ